VETLLEVRELEKRFGGLVVTDRVSFAVRRGERVALIGPNGAGKSTLFALIAGELRPDRGRVLLRGADVTRLPPEARARRGLSRSFQQDTLFDEASVFDTLALAVLAALGRTGVFWRDPARDLDVQEQIAALAAAVGLAGDLDRTVRDLSHGTRRQLEIALALAGRPAVLLLDEPTAGMGPHERELVLERLCALPGEMAVVLVEHDLDVVFAFAQRVLVLHYGRLVFEGHPEEAARSPLVREVYLGTEA